MTGKNIFHGISYLFSEGYGIRRKDSSNSTTQVRYFHRIFRVRITYLKCVLSKCLCEHQVLNFLHPKNAEVAKPGSVRLRANRRQYGAGLLWGDIINPANIPCVLRSRVQISPSAPFHSSQYCTIF